MVALVQSKSATGSGSSISATLTSSTTAGNCLVVCIANVGNLSSSASVSGVTIGGSASNFGQLISAGTAGTIRAQVWIWACPNCPGGQTAVQVNGSAFAANSGSAGIEVYEVSGLAATIGALLDKSSTGTGTGSSWSSGATGTTTNAAEFIAGCAAQTNVMSGPSSPWSNSSIATGLIAGEQVAASTGTFTYNGTAGGSANWAAGVVTLNPAPPPGAAVGAQAGPVRQQRPGRRSPQVHGQPGSPPYTPGPPVPPPPPSYGPARQLRPGMRGPGMRGSAGVVTAAVPGPPVPPPPPAEGPVRQLRPGRRRPRMAGAAGIQTPTPAQVVNQWAVTFAQPAAFGTTPPALQSSMIALTPATSVGGGTGVPSAGNWLFCIAGWNQAGLTASTAGVSDDIHSFWRPGDVTTSTWAVSTAAGKTRTSVWYSANIARTAGDVYCAPTGAQAGRSCLVIEVSGLGPWDTVTGIGSGYVAASMSLNLALGAPAAQAFILAAACGDSTAAGQQLAPAGWTALQTVSASNGTDHSCDAVLTSACVTASSSVSVNATVTSPSDISGVIIGVLSAAPSPVPGGANPAWAGRMILEAAFGSGFETPEDQRTWTQLNDNAWTSFSQGYKRLWSWKDDGGVPYALGQLQSGTGTVECDNADGKLSPSNPAALFYTSAAGWSPPAAFYDPLVSAAGPLAWWKLADTAGAGTAADSSGNGHAGTATSVTFGNTSEAVSGNTSASFASASSSHVLTTYNPALAAVTAECWVNLNGLTQGTFPRLLANSNTASDNRGFEFVLVGGSNTTPGIWFGNGTTFASVTASSPLPASGWTYLAATWDGATITLYVNGVAQGSAALTGPMAAGAANIGIGYDPAGSFGYFSGLLAECAVYGQALTGQQVAAHYTAGPSGTGVPVRLRCALGTIGGVTYNRWYVISRQALKWPERRNKALRGFVPLALTDAWSVMSGSCATPYRGEVAQDSPQSWWAMDDQPLAGGVQPSSLRNSAAGNTNPLTVYASAGGVTAGDQYAVNGADATTSGSSPASPSVAVAVTGQNAGWMYGDPQSSPASYQTGNPVTSSPGSASWQQTGLLGSGGSNTWFLAASDSSFPPLAAGATFELWFNAAFFGTASAWQDNGLAYHSLCGQPYSVITLATLATASAPVAVLQLDLNGHLTLTAYGSGGPVTTTIYSASDLRSSSWHCVTLAATTTAWTAYVDGGLSAAVSGTSTGMTSAWNWLVINGDLGGGGGSNLAAVQHGGNVAYSQAIVYPSVLPAWRVLAHYCAAATGFGALPAPQSVALSTVENKDPTGYTPDGSEYQGSYGHPGTITTYSFSGLVTAEAGAYTSGPSARATIAGRGQNVSGVNIGAAVWASWAGLAPKFTVYTAASADAETSASVVNGSGGTFTSGFGASAAAGGVCHVSGGSGAAPPSGPSSLGDTVAQRMERVLGYARLAPARAIDADAGLLVQAALDVGGQAAGASIQALVDSDNGLLYVGTDGVLHYRSRPHLAADQAAGPVWLIGMDVTGGQWPFGQGITYGNDPQQVFDAVSVQPYSPDGASLASLTPANAPAADAAQAQFGVRPRQITSYLQDQAKIQAAADWWLASFGTVRRRVETITLDAATHPAAWPIILGCNCSDIVQVSDMPFGAPATTGYYRVSSLSRSISYGANGSSAEAKITLTLDPLPASYWA